MKRIAFDMNERIPITPVSPESSSSEETRTGISRRSFLTAAATAMGAGILGKPITGQESLPREQQESPVDTGMYAELLKQKTQRIEYSTTPKELPSRDKDLLVALHDLQKKVLGSLQIDAGKLGDYMNVPQVHEQVSSPHDLREDKQAFWEKMRACFPNMPPYHPRTFYTRLLSLLPRHFAQYGLFIKPMLMPVIEHGTGTIERLELSFGVYQISTVERRTIKEWGANIESDIVSISGPAVIDGVSMEEHSPINTPGQTYYRNVLLYETSINKGYEEFSDVLQTIETLPAVSLRQQQRMLRSHPDPEYSAQAAAFVNLARRMIPLSREHVIANHVVHEARHVIDDSTPAFTRRFTPPSGNSGKELLQFIGSSMAHEEINGLLSELRYSPIPESGLYTIMTTMVHKSVQDYGHDQAALWVGERFIQYAQQHPEEFDIEIDSKLPVSIATQILLQFNRLAEQRTRLAKLCEELMKEHEQHYDTDLSREYLGRFGLSATNSDGLVSPILKGVGAAVALAMAYRALRSRLLESKVPSDNNRTETDRPAMQQKKRKKRNTKK